MLSTLARFADRRRMAGRHHQIASMMAAVLATSGSVLAKPPANNTSSWNVAGSGSWTVNSNWLGGTPVTGSAVSIVATDSFSRTVTYDYGGPSILFGSLQVDHTGNGTTLFAQHVGTFNASSEAIGNSASGSWSMDGGFHKIHGLVFGNQVGAIGAGKLQAGTLTNFLTSEAETIGAAGSGSFEQIGGSNFSGSLILGGASTGVGTYIQSGGTVGSSSEYVGASGAGNYTQSGGTFTTNAEYVGYSGTGTVSVQGGVHNVTHSYNGFGQFVVGYGPGSAGTFLLSGTGSLFDEDVVNIGYSGAGTFNQSGGTHFIGSRDAELPPVMTIGDGGGSGTYLLNAGTLLDSGNIFVGHNGMFQWNGGTWSAAAVQLSGGGKMLLSPGGHKAFRAALSIDTPNGSKLDLADNAAIIDYSGSSPLSTIAGYLQAGYASGAWTGNGITSSSAAALAADGSTAHKTALGFAEASALGLVTFAGQPVDSTSIVIRYTFSGDANLDGQVDVSDLGALATHWQTANVWSGGDFNYDGFVDVADLGALATNWQLGAGNPLGPDSSLDAAMAGIGLGNARVPEPAALSAIGIGCMATLWPRRSRRR